MKRFLHAQAGLALAVLVFAGLVAQPGQTAPAVVPASRPAPTPAPASQRVRGEDVRIEGKLYVPQAVFVTARPAESFGRDAIVPHVLDLAPTTEPLPYRLRPEKREPAAAAGAAAGNGKEP